MAATNGRDFGAILDDFIREFNCNPADRDDLCLYLTEQNETLKFDTEREIERIRKKLAKRNEARATQFMDIVNKLRSQPDLENADELILFLTTYAAKHQYAAKAERIARLTEANANANISSISETPIRREHITRFASPLHPITPSSGSSSSFFGPKHTPIITPQLRLLTGRAVGPSVVCEEELVKHALMALQGIEGAYIIRRGDLYAALQLNNTLAVDDILRSQLQRLLRIANVYLQLRHESQKSKMDRLGRAFCTGLSEILATYMGLISTLYTKYMSNPGLATCLDILLALSNWEIFLPFLLKLVLGCSNLKGMQIFTIISSSYRSAADQFVQQFLLILLKPMICIFHECLNSWLIYGRLIDPGFEWMIESKKAQTVKKNWTNEYEIISDAVPNIFEHFEGFKEKILLVGKTVSLLEMVGTEDDDLHIRQRILSVVNPEKCYLCISEAYHLWRAVKKLLHQINGTVSMNIVKKYDIHAHLLAVQHHYLLNDECFALTFYEKLKDESTNIRNGRLKFDSQQASEAFHAAIQHCKSWPQKIAQHAKIDATCGLMIEFDDFEGTYHYVASPRDQNGCTTIHLNYEAEIPISIVLNESAMERYQNAFEFIWSLLSTDFALTGTLQDHHCFMKNEPISDATPIVNVFTVSFGRISQFLSSLRSYVSHCVVSRLQSALFLEMNNVLGDLDAIIEAHNSYLAQLEEGLFLNEESGSLHNSFCALFTLITDLLSYYAKFRSEMVDIILARKRFSEQQKHLTGKNFHDTEFFEQEEEKIRLEELQQHLEEYYRPKVKMFNSKFVLLVRDILDILSTQPHRLYYADLALQLDLTGYYQQCEI